MRWVFGGEEELATPERQRAVELMDDVIARLVGGLSDDSAGATQQLASARAKLAELDERLELEVLGALPGPRTAVVSARMERRLRPMAEALVLRAPRTDQLRFVAHRPARSFSDSVAEVKASHGFDLANARARAGFSRGHLIDVVVYGPKFGGRGDDRCLDAADAAVESVLGERVMDEWIGDVAAEPLPGGGPLRVLNDDPAPTFPLSALPAAVSAAVEGLRAELPEPSRVPLPRDEWTLFETEPEPAHDYAAQDDVALAASALPEMLKCFLEGSPFSSLRFTRGGERFAYLKLDVHDVPFERRLGQRNLLEERLARALQDGKHGAVVGNGLGLRYAYLDIALSPEREALAIACQVARDLEVPRRSWLLFCDSDWAGEWVGVWPDSPSPPGV